MSIFPVNNGRAEASSVRRPLVFFLLAIAILGLFIYSGTAWVWFRPVVHKPIINRYAAEYKFDPLWVMAIIKVESRFEPWALSHRGAVGLMQLLPSTARELAPEIGIPHLEDNDLKDPDINIHLGVHYLSKLQHLFPEDDIAVLSAWNAGLGTTQQWRKGKPVLDLEDIAYPETRCFVKRVDQTFGWLKIVQGWSHILGFKHRHAR